MKAKVTNESVRDAVLQLYLNGKSASADDIAEHLGCSTSSVHKVMRAALGNVPGTTQAQSCGRTKTYWVPDRRYLGEIITQNRKTFQQLRRALQTINDNACTDQIAVPCVTALQAVESSLSIFSEEDKFPIGTPVRFKTDRGNWLSGTITGKVDTNTAKREITSDSGVKWTCLCCFIREVDS